MTYFWTFERWYNHKTFDYLLDVRRKCLHNELFTFMSSFVSSIKSVRKSISEYTLGKYNYVQMRFVEGSVIRIIQDIRIQQT